jgi:hypothetical protein
MTKVQLRRHEKSALENKPVMIDAAKKQGLTTPHSIKLTE